jgi:NAD(P)H-dependent flavin oxidoreductase YrpB (nitropropane dioxygenase family)
MKGIPRLRIGNVEAELPIIQGGMSVGISLSGLASAVAQQGGIGVIGGAAIGMLEPDFEKNFREANKRALRKEIRKAKEKTKGVIGLNLLVAQTDFDELFLTAIEEEVDLLFMGAGLPLKIPLSPDELKKVHTSFVTIVSSARAANLIFKYWANHYKRVPDAVVVEGPLAGGHLGFKKEQINDPAYQLEKIVSQVVEVIKEYERAFNKKIPVIAAGGIFTGKDIRRFLKLGASGVQMGTRFVATHECDAAPEFKEAYLRAKKEDIVIIDSPVGLPGRAIKSEFLEKAKKGEKRPKRCIWKCLKPCDFRKVPYCIALALTNSKKGNIKEGFAFAGANAYRIDKIISVKELIEELLEDYLRAGD